MDKVVKKSTTLFITPEGDVEAIHTDFVDGLNIGEKLVERVSDVEFDNTKQEWYAAIRPEFTPEPELLGKGEMRFIGPTRDSVLKIEHTYVSNFLRDKLTKNAPDSESKEQLPSGS